MKRQPDVIQGDITTLDVEAIVNAANNALAGGGGVDGAIHRAAGPSLHKACALLDGCNTGDAKVTTGFQLPASYIFHTVGPVWRGGAENESELLASCYRRCMELAAQHNVKSIAFPAISCGVYGFPIELAAPIAVTTVRDAWALNDELERVVFCCFDNATAEAYRAQLMT